MSEIWINEEDAKYYEICSNCKHCNIKRVDDKLTYECWIEEEIIINLINGNKKKVHPLCSEMRSSSGKCGLEGRYWEQGK